MFVSDQFFYPKAQITIKAVYISCMEVYTKFLFFHFKTKTSQHYQDQDRTYQDQDHRLQDQDRRKTVLRPKQDLTTLATDTQLYTVQCTPLTCNAFGPQIINLHLSEVGILYFIGLGPKFDLQVNGNCR